MLRVTNLCCLGTFDLALGTFEAHAKKWRGVAGGKRKGSQGCFACLQRSAAQRGECEHILVTACACAGLLRADTIIRWSKSAAAWMRLMSVCRAQDVAVAR